MYARKTSDGLRVASVHEGTAPDGVDAWPVVDGPLPPFDSSTHEAKVRGYAVVGTQVRRLWMVVPRPDIQTWQIKLSEGYVDLPTGIKLKTTQSAKQEFTSLVTSLQLAQSLNAVLPTTPVKFWDYADEEHTLPLSEFLLLMLRYSLHHQQLFEEYAP